MKKLQEILFTPKSPVALGLFRIGFGLIMIYQFLGIRPYFLNNLIYSKYYIKYDFFQWVQLCSATTLNQIFNIGIIASVFFMLGLLYRVSATILFVIWGYLFLTDQGHINNHYYLIEMFLFFLLVVKANQWASITSFFRESKLVSNWNYLVFKLLIFIVYFYGGLAKINSDWLVGHPLKGWLSGRMELGEVISGLLEDNNVILFMSYYGLFLDLSVGFLLFHNKLKYLALFLLVPFHIFNHFLWNIGVFPWMSIFMTLLFFTDEISTLFKFDFRGRTSFNSKNKNIISMLLLSFFIIQLLLPLRQFLYQGKTSWHGCGEYFSWRMMLTDRQGAVRMKIFNQDYVYLGEVSLSDYINDRQLYAMIHVPSTFVPFSKYIESEILADKRNVNLTDILIFVDVFKTINNRPFQRVIDPTIDLTSIEYSIFSRGSYILPFVDADIKENYNEISDEEFLRFIK